MTRPAEFEVDRGAPDEGSGAGAPPQVAPSSAPGGMDKTCPTCGHRVWSIDGPGSGQRESSPVGADLSKVLTAHQHVIDDAVGALPVLRLPDYERLGTDVFRERVSVLYGLILECLDLDTLEPMSRHGEVIAGERLESGFDLGEVQSAFNLLEEAVWGVAISHLPVEHHAEARSRIGRVVAAGKDGLARGWAARAAGIPREDELLSTVVESVAAMHPKVPREQLKEMAEEALAKTEDARVKGHRLPLAHHDVRERAAQWERDHHTR